MLAWDHTPGLAGLLTPGFPCFIQLLFLEYGVAISKAGPGLFLGVVTHRVAFSCEKVS